MIREEVMANLMELYKAIKTAKDKPKGIAVSTEMWALLKKAGVIEMKPGYGWGLFNPYFRDQCSDKFAHLNRDLP
jgi:hypothetical protein